MTTPDINPSPTPAPQHSGSDPADPADLTEPSGVTEPLTLPELLPGALGRIVTATLSCLDWAEDEIDAARTRHPRHADALFHSLRLLEPTQDRLHTEFVYRSHCRELLDRVAAGADTRTGTAAEVCCAMLAVNQAVPLRSAAYGLYLRMWQTAGFPDIDGSGLIAETSAHHEALEHTLIDDHEHDVRRRLAVPDRHLGEVACRGLHHGENVECVYAGRRQLARDGF